MSTSYRISHYELIDRMEKDHFWYTERNVLIRRLISRFIQNPQGKTLLEIGCGTGVLLPVFESLGFQVTGMDINSQALSHAKGRSHARLIRSSFFSYKQKKKYDCIAIFDILEHQHDDIKFLMKCYALLSSHGYLFISVPAHQWLWNGIDVISGHKRRYEKKDLAEKLNKAGFFVCFSNYWNTLLFVWYVLWRLQFRNKKMHGDMCRYLNTPAWITNIVCRGLLSAERTPFFHVPFPFGSSLIMVAKKE